MEVGGRREDIIQRLLSLPAANAGTASASGSAFTANGGATSSTNNAVGTETGDSEMEDDTADEIEPNGEEEEQDPELEGDTADGEEEGRDVEVEGNIAEEIAKVDALSAYDINLDKEVEAINEYLVMLDASQDSG